jgi:hypothetical protein
MKIKNSFVALFLSLASVASFAGTVTQVKNNKVMLEFDGETVNVGDQFFILNADGKKVAIVEITAAKNKKALANVLKGKAVIDGSTQAKDSAGGGSGSSGGSSSAASGSSKFIRNDMTQIAFHLKMMMNSISAKQQDRTLPFPNKETVGMQGTNFGFGASVDYKLMSWLKFHGLLSYEMLDVAGTAKFNSCDNKNSPNCNASISYFGFQGLARYDITKSAFNLWTGVGASTKFPLSKKSTAINTDALKQSDSAVFAFGTDYHINNKSFIPATFEYHYSLNTSEEVPTIDHMSFMVGYGFKF